MLCYVMLCCVVLCYVMSYCVMLCYNTTALITASSTVHPTKNVRFDQMTSSSLVLPALFFNFTSIVSASYILFTSAIVNVFVDVFVVSVIKT